MSWLAQLKSIPRTDSRSEAADKTDETPVLSVLSVLSGRRGERYLGPAPSDDPDADDNDAREERAEVIEFDGGMTRAEAERVAGITKVNANSEATLASDGFTSSRWPFEEWGDLRPCLMCRRLSQRRQCLAAEAGDLELTRFRGQVDVLVLWSSRHAALPILPDAESTAMRALA